MVRKGTDEKRHDSNLTTRPSIDGAYCIAGLVPPGETTLLYFALQILVFVSPQDSSTDERGLQYPKKTWRRFNAWKIENMKQKHLVPYTRQAITSCTLDPEQGAYVISVETPVPLDLVLLHSAVHMDFLESDDDNNDRGQASLAGHNYKEHAKTPRIHNNNLIQGTTKLDLDLYRRSTLP